LGVVAAAVSATFCSCCCSVGAQLQLYLHVLSLLGENGWRSSSSRNPFLLNKTDDILADKQFPADWWHFHGHRGYELLPNGSWDFVAPKPVVPASAGVRNGATSNGSSGTADVLQ